MRFEIAAATDQGMTRETNQDRFLVTPAFVAVADGMGGHAGGELAAETAVDQLQQYGDLRDANDMISAIQLANREVLAASVRTGMANMGTTVVAALLRPERRSVTIANVGDSRAYFFSGDELNQVTRDHSLVQELVRSGKISEAEARDHPHRNVVTRVLGIGEDPEVDIFDLAIGHGDAILLASDGLFNEVDHHVLATIIANADNLDEAAGRLIERANQNGGNDNITVVIVRVLDDAPTIAGPESAVAIAGDADVAPLDLETLGDADAEASSLFTPVVQPEPDYSLEEAPADELIDPVAEDTVVEADQGAADQIPTEEIPIVAGSRRRSGRRLRGLLFVLAFFILVGLGIGGFTAYGRNAWFVESRASEVVIFRGRPGGLLFIEPQAVETTGLDVNDLKPASRDQVSQTPVFGSLADAQAFVEQLELSLVRTAE
ncbi:MAG: Stp1/IreP family PP2C-type Ser/Thr phosphatase [Acidimicrobiales bacterium]|nr:Stp1/IreP family PP2C-type Ser/Thr phosphatase [Acidimicrobiales bacterium]